MLELTNNFIPTYAKNLLNDWPLIIDCIHQKTKWIKDTIHPEGDMNDFAASLLTELQVNDTLNGPFQHFFNAHFSAYAKIARIESALVVINEDFFKESEHLIETPFGVSKSMIASTDMAALIELRKKLDTLTREHYTQWETHITQWTELLLQDLKNNHVTLSELELGEFTANQPTSELHDRFINLKVALPKLSKSAFDFQQYFTLKVTLAVNSALSRTQQPHTEKDIDHLLKALHSVFKTIHHTEKELQKAHEAALGAITQGLG